MAAPLVIAGKMVLKAAASQIQKRYPGGLPGFIATIVLLSLFQWFIIISATMSIISSLSTGSAINGDQCAFVEDFSYVSSESSDGGEGTSAVSDDKLGDPTESSTLLMPLTNVRVTSNYGPRTPPRLPGGGFGSAYHRGTDYQAGAGTAIYAVADGIVYRTEYNSGHGHRIVIKHRINGKNWYVLYAHTPNSTEFVKAGDSVKAGDRVGSVGTTGASQGPHLHMEVWDIPALYGSSGSYDAHKWLMNNGALKVTGATGSDISNISGTSSGIAKGGAPDSLFEFEDIDQLLIDCNITDDSSGSSDGNGIGAGAWGGHKNGKIPTNLLCKIKVSSSTQYARCDAAEAFEDMSKAYKKKFGSHISITDGYRTFESQVALKKQKPYLAAVAGTSNHGWALAMDLGGGINNPTSATHKWMKNNAKKYGWIHPKWAWTIADGGNKPEAWHWEYVGRGDKQGLGTVSEAQNYAKKAMKDDYNWGSKENACLVKMWNKESGWDYKAANPISTARGIPQAMMSIHFGSDWASNAGGKKFLSTPSVQIDWGLKYIQGRYLTPCSAWSYWQKNSHY